MTSSSSGSSLLPSGDRAALAAAAPNAWQDDDALLARDLFGTADRERITSSVCQWVSERLGGPVRLIDIEMSIGAAITLECLDGSKVFLKVLGDAIDPTDLEAQTNVQCALAQAGFPAPRVLSGPSPLGSGTAVLMAYDRSGQPTDCRIEGVRDGMAASLARLIRDTASLAGIRPPRKPLPSSSAIWPKPHSALFDFAATRESAAPIDEVARDALAVMASASSPLVIGHHDWSAKNMRMSGDEVAVVYDWDSIFLDRETFFVGSAAAHFPMTWELPVPVTPTREDVAAFVRAYEIARGTRFTQTEIVEVAASITYSRAYKARCEHALDPLGAELSASSREDLRLFGPVDPATLRAGGER